MTTPMRLAPARSSASSDWRTARRRLRLHVEDEDRGVALRGDGHRVGEQAGGRRVDDDEAHGPQRVEHVAERSGTEHAGRVLHRRAAREHPEVRVVGDLGAAPSVRSPPCSTEESPGARGMPRRSCTVGLRRSASTSTIFSSRAGGRLREVRGGERLAGGLVGADDRDGARLARAFEHHEVRAQDAERLDDLDAFALGDLGEDGEPGEARRPRRCPRSRRTGRRRSGRAP